jgi:hypothetical protein
VDTQWLLSDAAAWTRFPNSARWSGAVLVQPARAARAANRPGKIAGRRSPLRIGADLLHERGDTAEQDQPIDCPGQDLEGVAQLLLIHHRGHIRRNVGSSEGGRQHVRDYVCSHDQKAGGLPPDLIERIRVFRHANMIDHESEAIRLLIQAGLDALAPTNPAQDDDQ